MAAKRMSDKPHFLIRMILSAALVSFVIWGTCSIISTQNSIAEKKRELAALEESVEALAAENEELSDLIESDDIGRYMEKLAMKDNGYAYPDERRYYDTSRD